MNMELIHYERRIFFSMGILLFLICYVKAIRTPLSSLLDKPNLYQKEFREKAGQDVKPSMHG